MFARRARLPCRRIGQASGPLHVPLVLPVLLVASHAAAVAQDPSAVLASCDGRIVSEIVINPRDPSFLSIPRSLRPLARAVGLHHATTKERVIGRFSLLDVGEACTEEQRAETERILRLQPFLADASVVTVEDARGGVRVEIETTDEIPTVLGLRVREWLPSAVRFGNGNVTGRGLHLAGRVERGFAYRYGVGVEANANQVFGRPYLLSVEAQRLPLGSTFSFALGHAFLTDLQRNAWHVGFMDVNRYLSFVPPEGDELSLAVEREFWNVGGVHRLGVGRHIAFAGTLLSLENVTPAGSAVVVSDSGVVADTTGALGGPYPAYRNLRGNVVVGVRSLSFMPVRGFDALAGAQDVATGVQLGAVVGQGIARFGSYDDDRFLAVDLYVGHGSATSFVGLRVEGEARQDLGSGRWDSMVGSGRFAWYRKPTPAHVLIGSLEVGVGHRHRVPFQLMLGQPPGGVRGYSASRRAGSARTVLRLEERWYVGNLSRHGAFGFAVYADAGSVWAGDAPFGTDSGTKLGVGAGLLVAFPPESGRLWRLDVAVPMSADPHAGWEIRLTSAWARSSWQEPEDVARGRGGAAPSAIFRWP